ncbi:conserved hypothetical protein [Hyphomicrobium denitrificans ATCC 51888]|uniref:HEPN domain-containing protein n=1 Tax=Hyphomicrobium denitrificans (strain ATCC 51888 / DSM 1869 / NCIMB 11706 / TK 0415) TaxID=582899 RepID=D8JR06_HYPDA|nr:conserved hypothetical protein [Hyphomicrobium denitrificans ATCC 51888]
MAEAYNQSALRHYFDSEKLADLGRFDNAGHLIGFAAECALKHAFAIMEPVNSPRVHLPDLANALLKHVKSRNSQETALRNLLAQTKGGFFDDWRVAARYEIDGLVDQATYRKWRGLAQRAIGAAGLRP